MTFTILRFPCVICGARYHVYITERMIGELGGVRRPGLAALETVDWTAARDGSIDDARYEAELLGATFVDMRETTVMDCPCGATYDLEVVAKGWHDEKYKGKRRRRRRRRRTAQRR